MPATRWWAETSPRKLRRATPPKRVFIRMLMGLVLLSIITLFLLACGVETNPCGTFSFSGSAHSNRGIDMTLNFDFDPNECAAAPCTTNTVAYVQIVRIIDLDTGGYLSPNQQQTDRIVTGRSQATLNGWAVDRLAGRVWGYYGRNNDGTFASTLTPGSDTTDAILRDRPSGWPNRSWFDAVSVPVSIDASSPCINQLAGYYYWWFVVGTDGVASDPFDWIGVEWMRDSFDEAVIEWNNDAAGLLKNAFPAFTRMP
jgi:hypothetical protein